MSAPTLKVEIAFHPPNLLTAEDASFETGIGTWAATDGIGTVEQTSGFGLDGDYALYCTSPSVISGHYSVVAGQRYSVQVAHFEDVASFALHWYDESLTELSTKRPPRNLLFTQTPSGVYYYVCSTSAIAPSDAASVRIQVDTDADDIYIDEAGLFRGAVPASWCLGTDWIDVTDYLVQEVQVNRGRSRELDQYQAGTATVTFSTGDRRFDPSNTDSPYYPYVVPRRPIRVSIDDVIVFRGFVEDFNVAYSVPNIAEDSLPCSDAFAVLANQSLASFSGSAQYSGDRVQAILTAVGYTGDTSLDTGLSKLQANDFTNLGVLDGLQTCARSENGFLFVAQDGTLTFFDRNHVLSETSAVTFSDSFDDDTVPYQGITQAAPSDLLYNQVTGTRSSTGSEDPPEAKTASDLDSQGLYDLRQLTLGTLENGTDPDVDDLCHYIVGRYSSPDVRFDTITVDLFGLDDTTRATLLGLELADLLTVECTPRGDGSPTTISKLSIVDSLKLSLDAASNTCQLVIGLGSVDTRRFFRLDDAVFGKLDSGNRLGF